MGLCYRVFKVVVIILTLIQFGLGYTKVYQLFADIGSSLSDGGSVNSFSDLAWLPYLFIQIFTTVFIILQVYFLSRELCYEDFMYIHCFRCCFVLTALNFLLVIFPKTIINIVYHNTDITVQEWWTQIVDTLDSFVASLANLGFQIILYMRLIRSFCRFLKCCKQKVAPIMVRAADKTKSIGAKGIDESPKAVDGTKDVITQENLEDDCDVQDETTGRGCCLFVPMATSKVSENSSFDQNTEHNPKRVHFKVREATATVFAKKNELQGKLNSAVTGQVDKATAKVKDSTGKMKSVIREKTKTATGMVTKNLNIANKKENICVCENPVVEAPNPIVTTTRTTTAVLSVTDELNKTDGDKPAEEATVSEEPYDDQHKEKQEGQVEDVEQLSTAEQNTNEQDKPKHCATCGKMIREFKASPNRISKIYNSKGMMKCRTLCGLLENRPFCMKLTLAMSCFHFLMYIVELVFIFL